MKFIAVDALGEKMGLTEFFAPVVFFASGWTDYYPPNRLPCLFSRRL